METMSRLHRKSDNEHGQATVETAFVIGVFFALLFGLVELGHLAFTVSALDASLQRAMWEMDAGELEMSLVKSAFVVRELMEGVGLYASQIDVTNVSVTPGTIETEQPIDDESAAGLASMYRSKETAAIEFDITYEVPLLYGLFGIDALPMSRHVAHRQVLDDRLEVRR